MEATQRPSFSELVSWLYRRLQPPTHGVTVANSNSSSSSIDSRLTSAAR